MNAERLHAIALAVQNDLRVTEARATLRQLVSALENAVNSPASSQYQEEISEARTKLLAALDRAPSNGFSPAWRQTLEELGIDDILGENLRGRIEEVFARNQITLASAQEELAAIADRMDQLGDNLDHLVQSLQWLGVGSEDLQPGQVELGVLIPREAVRENLGELGTEFRELERILQPFAELVTGSRPALRIKTISSSDFSVFLDSIPAVAACLAHATERIIVGYKGLLEIRKLKGELEGQGLTSEDLEPIERRANERMSVTIDEAVADLISRFGSAREQGRLNELSIEIKRSMNSIANRIDEGYNIEVRAEPLPAPEESADGDREVEPLDATEIRQFLATVEELRPTMEFINLTGSRLLALPEEASSRPADGDRAEDRRERPTEGADEDA